MSPKVLLEVSLRVIGCWFVVTAVVETSQMIVTYATFAMGPGVSTSSYLGVSIVFGMIRLAAGAVVVLTAPIIAGRFYPNGTPASDDGSRIGPGDIYHTASFVLGGYFLVNGIAVGVQLAIHIASNNGSNQLPFQATSAIVYIAGGLLLIFGARRIAEMLLLLKHDPDSIPKQQFSLKLLLRITFVVAIVLGVIRVLVVGGP